MELEYHKHQKLLENLSLNKFLKSPNLFKNQKPIYIYNENFSLNVK